jgi:hypothetical protein
MSRFAVLRHLARELDSNAAQQLESSLGSLFTLVSTIGSDKARIASEAARVQTMAAQLEQRVKAGRYDAALTMRLMKSISGDADYISSLGERAAEQAAMALDSLFVTYSRNTNVANAAQVRTAIQALFKQVENPSAYNAFSFAQQMRAVNGLLP